MTSGPRNLPSPEDSPLRRPARGLHFGDGPESDSAPPPPPRPGRSRGGKRPHAAAADAVPTTVRWDPEEARQIDRWVLELADAAGRRRLDKSEVIRELVRLAQEHPATANALVRRLR